MGPHSSHFRLLICCDGTGSSKDLSVKALKTTGMKNVDG